ncbi:hypothetical protein LOTGIDRAFT_175897 [Lottia gigantea]|uniref:Adenosine deaminase domain-containing protein n=1 Tax=Lottia gigantea TaxID=225164 RepID=V3ZZX0_LOTGI|nr:hypothetical protein LOTGIDRAFT_175897 [Lottia gigantea]ESO88220.1 hypothetical protein LOTGIDRAFT_175897 [Lottia gigantea]
MKWLVDDIRNHPGAILMTKKFPVVVSSDDPAVWGAKPLSHDFYMAFMGMCGADEGIAILKQLAYNSIQDTVVKTFALSSDRSDQESHEMSMGDAILNKLRCYD